MISSMTGFGSSRIEVPNLTISLEAKTVNHRYLDLHIRLPAEFQTLEAVVREAISGKLHRGRVDIFAKIELRKERAQIEAHPELIASYVELVGNLQSQFPITGDMTLEAILQLPGAITISNDDLTAEERDFLSENLQKALLEAMEQLCEMRREEGKALAVDLQRRIQTIRTSLETIRQGATGLLQHYRELLKNRVAELAPSLSVDSSRLEVEALIHAEKSDISEEITRLESHLDHFVGITSRENEAGKRLDFLLQEMNREANTILSKTSGLNQSGVAIGEAAIEIKVEIDKLREQVQNIE